MRRVLPGWRALGAATSFAFARVRARPSRGLVAAAGIAISLAALLITVSSPSIAGDVALREALVQLPPAERSVTVAATIGGLTDAEVSEIDQQVRRSLRSPGLGPVRNQLEYRALAATDGAIFRLAGVDDLPTVVSLRTGRLPETCTPTLCEVVMVAPATQLALQDNIGLSIVGQVDLIDTSLLSGTFAPEAGEVVLLGNGFAAVGAVQPLELIGRSAGWVSAIDPAALRGRDMPRLLSAAARTRTAITTTTVEIDLPDRALKQARARSRAAGNRAVIAAAQGVVLLVAFVLLAAAAGRREHTAARELLRRRGAARSVLNWFTACEALWPITLGALIGVPVGIVAVSRIAHRYDLPADGLVGDILANAAVRLIVGAIALFAAMVCIMAAAPSVQAHQRKWWRPTSLDLVGLGSLAAATFAVSRGDQSLSDLVVSGDPLLAVLPVLAAIVVAWVALRLVPAFVSVGARLLRQRNALARVSLAEVTRGSPLPIVTAGFLSAATMLGVFALGYRDTLQRGAIDQAAFAVPYDFTLSEGPQLVRPATVAPDGGWETLPAGVSATALLRRGVNVQTRDLSTLNVGLIGLDPATLVNLQGWRQDFGPPPAALQAAIESEPVAELGSPLDVAATELVITGSGNLKDTAIYAILARGDGSWHEATANFKVEEPNLVRVVLEAGDAGGRLIGFRLGQRGEASDRFQHKTGEGSTDANSFTASIIVNSVEATTASGSTEVNVDWDALQSINAAVAARDDGAQIDLRLQGSSALVLPDSNSASEPLLAIVDPATAATANNGLVTMEVTGGERRLLRVAAVATRFAGAPEHFAIVDYQRAKQMLDLLDPGLGTATEVWLAAESESQLAEQLADPRYSDLIIERRASLQAELESDPLATFTLALFGAAALIAALLAIGATYLATLASATSQAPLHRALVAEGVKAAALRRMVGVGAMSVVVSATVIGALGALILLRVVTKVIAVTAAATVPVPPLISALSASLAAAALLAVVLSCSFAAAIASRTAGRVATSDVLREFG